MGSKSLQQTSLLDFRRLFLWIFRARPNLIRYFGHVRRLWLKIRALFGKPEPPSAPSQPKDCSEQTTTSASYTIVKDGSTITLDGVAASSLYPFSNGNIRNTSRASVRSSHNPSVQSRNASRSSRRPGSVMSRRSGAASYYALPLPQSDTATTRPHPHPIPRRQWSASMPHLQPEGASEREGSIDIEVTSPISPGNYSQNSLRIPPNPLDIRTLHPFPPHEPNADTVGSPTTYEQTTFDIPPSSVSTNTHDLSRSTHDHAESSRARSRQSHISASRQSTIEERYIKPSFPDETRRYTERTRLTKIQTNLTFPPINLDYSKPSPPDGWERYAHPEGARYFYNKKLRIYTDSEIYDPDIRQRLLDDHAYLQAQIPDLPNPFPPTGEYVINVYRDNITPEDVPAAEKTNPPDDLSSEYYCIDHNTRLIFWLKESRSDWSNAWFEVTGVRSAFQFQIELLAQYWYFIQLYPNAVRLQEGMVRELRDIVLHLIGDSMTSPFSTACFPLDNLYKILSLTRELDRNVNEASHGSMCLLGRMMYIFNHSRFLNFHGESSARIERDFSVYDDQSLGRRTWLIKTFSFVLFSAPEVHLKNLHKMWVDGMMHKSVWEETMKRLNEEWQEFIFFATVVLNANVAFLAIQSVDIDMNPYRSPAQISSYLSVVANIGSIILGLLLMRQNRTKNRETADDVQKFLMARNHPRLGLESLAILYSLPYALLMWGMVAFLAAFAFTWFEDSNASTRAMVGSSCCAMVILIVWCISVSWEKNPVINATERRALAYDDPDNVWEEVEAEEEPPVEPGIRILGRTCHPPAFMAVRRFLTIPSPFKPKRESYDSGKTGLTPGDV